MEVLVLANGGAVRWRCWLLEVEALADGGGGASKWRWRRRWMEVKAAINGGGDAN